MGGRTEVDLTQLRTVADHVMQAADAIAEMRWPDIGSRRSARVGRRAASPHRTWSPRGSPRSSPTCVAGRWRRTCRPTPSSAPTAATVTVSARGDAADRLASRSVAARFTAAAGRRLGRGGTQSGGARRHRHAGNQPQPRILDRRHGRRRPGQRARHCGRRRRRGPPPCHRVGRRARWRRPDRRGSRRRY